jgi:ELWxxDGT repeat protein
MKRLVLLSFFTTCTVFSFAQEPVLLKDINPLGDANPGGFTTYNGKMYFSADDGTNGRELWVTDGTATGTVMVKDINAGVASGAPEDFIVMNGKLYFTADDGAAGRELWVSDGTPANTQMPKDIAAGATDSDPGYFAVLNNKLFFEADDNVNGQELWVSDGTSVGTVLLKDMVPGAGNSNPLYIKAHSGKLFFNATDGVNGRELWVSDGTTAGTTMLKNIHPSSSSSPDRFMALGGKLYFSAYDGTDAGLWETDGTTAGTVMVAAVNIGGCISGTILDVSAELGGKRYFQGSDAGGGCELWATDGTSAGTVLLKDIQPGASGSVPFGITPYKGKLYFRANDGVVDGQVWQSDGTGAGTTLLKTINPTGNSGANAFTEYRGKLYFTASDGANGSHLWVTDGNPDSTKMIAPAISPLTSPVTGGLYVHDTTLYFPVHYRSDVGKELYYFQAPDPLAVNEPEKRHLAKVHPNPASKVLYISLSSEGCKVWLFNAVGKLVANEKSNSAGMQLDISSCVAGIYLLKVEDKEGQVYQQRVAIQ